MRNGGRLHLLQAYYLATPLFFAADRLWGIGVRVPLIVEGALLRNAYYGFCLLCGIATCVRPKFAPYIGLGESSLNILLLAASVIVPVYTLHETIMEPGEFVVPVALTVKGFVNFCLAAAVWMDSFYCRQAELVALHPGLRRDRF